MSYRATISSAGRCLGKIGAEVLLVIAVEEVVVASCTELIPDAAKCEAGG